MVLNIKANEQGLIRLFAVNRAPADMTRALKTRSRSALQSELIGMNIPEGGAELFPVADLSGVGLSGYLADGYGVSDAQIAESRARLDRLDGYVLLLFSSAFGGAETTLKPGPDLTLIGTFGEPQPDMTTRPLHSDAARGSINARDDGAHRPARSNTGPLIVLACLFVLAALVLWRILG